MNRIASLIITLVAGFVLMLHITPSWGGPPNPTDSDAHHNTAGGTDALINVDPSASGGFFNTAFGHSALRSNTIGDANTASGANALDSNTTGGNNTANG